MNRNSNALPDDLLPGQEDDLNIESLLREMPLRAPAQALDARVRGTIWRAWAARQARAIAFSAAALLAIAIGAAPLIHPKTNHPVVSHPMGGNDKTSVTAKSMPLPAQPLALAAAPARPLLIRQTFSRTTDDGIVAFAGDVPLKRYRRQTIELVSGIDPRTGRRVQVTIPRQQVVVCRIQPF